MSGSFTPSELWPETKLAFVEAQLTPQQRLRLVEIAYDETASPEVRDAALALLRSQRLMIADVASGPAQ